MSAGIYNTVLAWYPAGRLRTRRPARTEFGFINPSGLRCEGVRSEVFFALAFEGTYPQGEITFHPAFLTAGPAPPEEEEPSLSL